MVGHAAALIAMQAAVIGTNSNLACVNGNRCEASLTASQMFNLADQMQARGRFEDAEIVLETLTRNVNIDVRSEARFRLGLLHERRGDWNGAAHAYRAVLEERPFAVPVRLELARVLAAMGDEAGARRQLRMATSSGLPENVVRAVNQFQSALRSRKKLGLSVEVGFAPDSNVNRAQGHSSIDIGSVPFELSSDAAAQSGVGVTARGQGYWRPQIGRDLNALITFNVDADLYRKHEFDDVFAFLTAGPEFQLGQSRVRISSLIGQRWFGLEPYSTSYGATLNVLRSLGAISQIQLDAAVIRNDHKVNRSLSGVTASGTLRYGRAISPRLSGRITLRGDRKSAGDPAFATWSAGGELLIARETGPATLYGRAGYYRTWADEAFSFPPARRQDNLFDIEAGMVMSRLSIWGSAPVVRLHWTRSSSPVFFYDFERTRLEFAFTRDF